METKQIINGLLDRADRVEDQSAGRIMRQAAERLRELDQEQKWIPVTERLPEQDGWYMVYTKNKGDIARRTNKAQYCHHSWYGNGGRWDNVTHWMPLPNPPKEVE